jgi:hypothetical protein
MGNSFLLMQLRRFFSMHGTDIEITNAPAGFFLSQMVVLSTMLRSFNIGSQWLILMWQFFRRILIDILFNSGPRPIIQSTHLVTGLASCPYFGGQEPPSHFRSRTRLWRLLENSQPIQDVQDSSISQRNGDSATKLSASSNSNKVYISSEISSAGRNTRASRKKR